VEIPEILEIPEVPEIQKTRKSRKPENCGMLGGYRPFWLTFLVSFGLSSGETLFLVYFKFARTVSEGPESVPV
jgi:hypothetical protein